MIQLWSVPTTFIQLARVGSIIFFIDDLPKALLIGLEKETIKMFYLFKSFNSSVIPPKNANKTNKYYVLHFCIEYGSSANNIDKETI